MKGGFGNYMPDVADYSEFSAAARSAKIAMDEGKPVLDQSADALRGANYALIIEQLWKGLFDRLPSFAFSPNAAQKDRWVDLRDRIKKFVELTVTELFAELLKDERFSVNYRALKVLEQGGPKASMSPAENILNNLETAINVSGEFGELAIVMAAKEANRLKKDRRELAREILHSATLFGIISNFAYLPGSVAAKLADKISVGSVMLGNRGKINPLFFSLSLGEGGRPCLEMDKAAFNGIRASYSELKMSGTNAICPAALAKSDNGIVLKDFIKWMLEQVEAHYLEDCLRRQ